MAARGARVLIGPSSFGEADPTPLRRLAEAGCAVIPNPHRRKLTQVELTGLLAGGVVGAIAGLELYSREVLQGSGLRVVSRVGAGLANVDTAAAQELGIAVCSTPDGPTEAVAELTLGAMLGLMRHIPRMDRALHAGAWEKRLGAQLEGKTVAIVGYGRIGRRVAELLAPFRVSVLVVDPAVRAAPGVTVVPLDVALREAHIVTLHVSGEDRVIGAAQLALMRPGALLLNAARGGVVEETAVAQALASGRLAGVWLDAFGAEPYAGPLAGEERALLTPHVGSYTVECRFRMETEAVENLLAALERAPARRP